MKKHILIVLLFLLFLVGCDYPEKSFQALSRGDIPTEVTMNFELPKGIYAEFIWTSMNEDILRIVDKRFVEVEQQDEDVEVEIMARINRKTEKFKITVLKIGSAPTIMEQAIIVLENLKIPNEVIEPFCVPSTVDNIVLEYKSNKSYYYMIKKKDDSLWIVPHLLETERETQIIVRAYYKQDDRYLGTLSTKIFKFKILVDSEGKNEHKKVFDNLQIGFIEGNNPKYVTDDFILPVSSELNDRATISWKSNDLSIVEISKDGITAHVNKQERICDINLIAMVTIDEIYYQFYYRITVYPDQ